MAIIGKIIACAILILWWFMVIEIGWDNKLSKTRNVIFGTIVFIIISFIYMFPAWVFFK